ncbi:MAG: glycosyltransferase [Rugosibacter sp.]|nr:glycosyltransferase [Rugosibacter sp.]
MKILFSSRTTLFSVPGGDTVQLVKTAEYLRNAGVEVDISTELEPSLNGYDLVHLFNLMRPQDVYLQARNAKRQGKRVALSTIYGRYIEYEHKVRGGLAGWVVRHISSWQVERLKVIARAIVNREINKGSLFTALFGYRNLCGRISEMVDVFLPNSQSEMYRVHEDFPVAIEKPFVVVPNAVDISVFDQDQVVVNDEVKKFEGCVLCVARIEGRKCQLDLVRAIRDLPYQLVLIGKPAPNHLSYFDEIKREASDRIHILGQVPHEELAQYYKAAKVHALISWMETPGLSSLEAGAMNCNLVITAKGDTRDYFGDDAFYCEPDSIDSIRDAIVRAYNTPVDPALSRRIREDYNWQKTAEKTLEGYQYALA